MDYSKFVFLHTKTKTFLQCYFDNEEMKDLGTQITVVNQNGGVIFDYFFKCSYRDEEKLLGLLSPDDFDENANSMLEKLLDALKDKTIIAFNSNRSILEIVHICKLYKIKFSDVSFLQNTRKKIKHFSLDPIFHRIIMPDSLDPETHKDLWMHRWNVYSNFEHIESLLNTYFIHQDNVNVAAALPKLFSKITEYNAPLILCADDVSQIKFYARLSIIDQLKMETNSNV